MARSKGLRQAAHRGFDTSAKVKPAAAPTTCHLSDDTPEGVKGKNGHLVLQTHLMEQHRPVTRCPRGHPDSYGAEAWQLDWDSVVHHQLHLWYCRDCGFYL